jgi:hypothetical protein
MRRLAQMVARANGTRRRSDRGYGDGFERRRGPEREPKVAKRVVGRAKVVKSFAVKR